MLNRLARDATGMTAVADHTPQGCRLACYLVVHVCMCVYVSVAQPSPPLEESVGPEALLPTLLGSPVASSLGS